MIRWISEYLGSSSRDQVETSGDLRIVDVRDLVDKPGNLPQAAREKIAEGVGYLESGKRVVVCCDYGISRSNAVAAGILSSYKNLPFEDAVRQVIKATGEKAIRIEVLSVVREALGLSASVGTDRKAVLITGGSGFLGSALREQLPTSRVHAPSRAEIDLNRGAVELDLFVKEHNIGHLVHLANPHVLNTNEAMGETLVLLKNVLDVCRQNDLRLIFPSSWEVFSGYAGDYEAQENFSPLPKGAYGQTKYLCELLLDHYQKNLGMALVLLRSSPVYGGAGDRPKFIFNFRDKAARNEEIVTHRYLNGFPRLDLLHVDDLTSALVKVIESDYQGTLHVGSGRGISTAEVAGLVVESLGSHSKITHREINEYAANIVMDCARAKSVLGWQPRVSFEEGLRKLLSETMELKTSAEGN
jgi:UDP-glucuronate decarboxylase